MTGGCHYSGDCRNYLFDCGHCPVINSKKLHDISYRNLLHRKEALIDKKIIIVGKSNWITESARKSSLFKNVRTETIGNIVDTDFFRPCNQKKVIDSRVKIGIGGLNILSLNRKNSVDLELLIKILVLNKFEVTLFGVKKNSLTLFPYLLEYSKQQKIIIQEEKFTKIEIKKIYDTFDVYIHTASQENLSNQVMEILSCGIPVIGLDVGGNSDLIISGWNGYLIKEAKIKLFIYFLNKIANERTYSFLSKNARNHIINNYSKVNIVNKYISLYQELLGV
jgi:glycosyltransferase involved in cell wall biosynthesis